MNIDNNCVVSIHYRLTNEQGEVLDTSAGQDPLTYVHGGGGIIPGLEQALSGREPGEQFQVTVPPDEAFGPVHEELIQTVPHEAFQDVEVEQVEPGMQFQAQGPEGEVRRITVLEVQDEGVKVDGNHPLAGEVLHFDVTVEEVREATEEEIEHGHSH